MYSPWFGFAVRGSFVPKGTALTWRESVSHHGISKNLANSLPKLSSITSKALCELLKASELVVVKRVFICVVASLVYDKSCNFVVTLSSRHHVLLSAWMGSKRVWPFRTDATTIPKDMCTIKIGTSVRAATEMMR
jgi:hypothetical protein